MPTAIPESLQLKIRQDAGNRCGYCLVQQQYIPWKLEIEHIRPRSKGGSNDEENLWLACRSCNLYKSNQTSAIDPLTGVIRQLFNPRTQLWQSHFQWSHDGTMIIGLTPCGRASVATLNLNNLVSITARRNWVAANWHPPSDP